MNSRGPVNRSLKSDALRWDDNVAADAGNPRLQVEVLFDVLMTSKCSDEPRAGALANAAVEITEPDHPARPVVENFKTEIRRRFRKFADEMLMHSAMR
jgi:hypothetical protein